jgi:hypothetical protein
MCSMIVTRLRSRLETSPNFCRLASKGLILSSSARVTQSFPMFAPFSAGSTRNRAVLTIQAANQTFPLMLDLLSRAGRTTEDPVSIESFVDSDDKRAAAEQLKDLYDYHGSDKSAAHNYHLLYGPILAERDSVAAVLEIGLGTNNSDVVSNMGANGKPGASLRAFREFLPNAQIYGADIDRRILFSEERISTFFVDQTDPGSFDAIADAVGDSLDLIVDDGLHSPNANLATLLFGLERLKIGGWLVIEDIAPLALPIWKVIGALIPSQYDCRVVAAKEALLFSVRRLALKLPRTN